MQGWVKLHRKLLLNPIIQKPHLLQLFIYCILKANHDTEKFFWGTEEIEVKRGQFVTGRFSLSQDLKCNVSTIYKRLQTLRKTGLLNTKSNNKNTLVTIINYELYQSDIDKSNSKRNNKVTTKEQQSNTNKNDKNERTKELKDIYKKAQHLFLTKEEYDKLVLEYGQARVDDKLEYAENYTKLKNYKSLYLTLNNWLKKDGGQNGQATKDTRADRFKEYDKSKFLA